MEGRCLDCGKECFPLDEDWPETVNLTPDVLWIGHEDIALDEQLPTIGENDGHSWCGLQCFARWCWNHARMDTTKRELVAANV